MFQLQLFFLLHCDEWDRVVALQRHKFVTGATLLQLEKTEGPIKNGQSRETGNTKKQDYSSYTKLKPSHTNICEN